jgi:N,N'-diacetyllegionaminate synthase
MLILKKRPLFVAEIGMNYNGNIDLASELIKQAKLSGADIAKFQLGWRDKPGEINCLDISKIKKLIGWGEYYDIEIMFSIISHNALKIIKKFKFNKYKIASRTLKYDLDLARKIVNQKKITFISLGMWDKKLPPFKKDKKIFYLWCKSNYPNDIKDLKCFPKSFNNSIYDGYSDHTIGIETSILAVARGAKIIEKHFTLDKSENIIRDHLLSATPSEFRNLVDISTDIYKKINNGV